MRKFRNAALAAATATAVAFGGTAIATAAPQPNGTSSSLTSGTKQEGDTSIRDLIRAIGEKPGLGAVGDKTDANVEVDVRDVWGKEVYDKETPQWARIWRDTLNWGALLTIIGTVIGAANWALYNGLLPQIDWKTMTLK